MLSLAGWMGVLGGLVAAAHVFSTVSRRIRRLQYGHTARQRQLLEASRQVRERAKATLDLRREEQDMRKELTGLGREIEQGEQVVLAKRGQEAQLYVFDERRNVGDQAFIVPICHRSFADLARYAPEDVTKSWAEGRRYLVWAASAKMAGAKSGMRFPSDKGYTVGVVEEYAGNPDEL